MTPLIVAFGKKQPGVDLSTDSKNRRQFGTEALLRWAWVHPHEECPGYSVRSFLRQGPGHQRPTCLCPCPCPCLGSQVLHPCCGLYLQWPQSGHVSFDNLCTGKSVCFIRCGRSEAVLTLFVVHNAHGDMATPPWFTLSSSFSIRLVSLSRTMSVLASSHSPSVFSAP